MCDKAGKAEKPELQAAAREDAATATPQVVAAATATPQVTARKDAATAAKQDTAQAAAQVVDPEFARAENEDDDGYDPYSDRRPASEPLFERDPWS